MVATLQIAIVIFIKKEKKKKRKKKRRGIKCNGKSQTNNSWEEENNSKCESLAWRQTITPSRVAQNVFSLMG